MSEAVTSAGTSQGCYADEVLTCGYSGCAARLLSSDGGRPPYCPLMRHKEKRRCSPTAVGVGRSADVPGPKSGVHGKTCVVREETTSTKVVLWSRVRSRSLLCGIFSDSAAGMAVVKRPFHVERWLLLMFGGVVFRGVSCKVSVASGFPVSLVLLSLVWTSLSSRPLMESSLVCASSTARGACPLWLATEAFECLNTEDKGELLTAAEGHQSSTTPSNTCGHSGSSGRNSVWNFTSSVVMTVGDADSPQASSVLSSPRSLLT